MFKVLQFLLFVAYVFCNNIDNQKNVIFERRSRNSYYFKLGRNNNDVKLNNRIYFLNHNITDLDYPNGRVENMKKIEEKPKHPEFKCYLDEEWDYERKNTTKSELPLFVHKFYEKLREAPTEKYITRILFNNNINSTSNVIKLNLDSLDNNETIQDADLYFYWPLKNTSTIHKQSAVLRLYQFERTGELQESQLVQNPDVHKLFNVIYVSKADKGWQIFKLKKPIDNWLNGEENLGLLLTISSHDDNKLIEIFNDTNEGIYRTFAVVRTVLNGTSIEGRNASYEKYLDTSSSNQCQKTAWKVNFEHLGWNNFIVAPKEFVAYDCSGRCVNFMEPSTPNHLKLLNVFQKRSGCCVPTVYHSLPIMYHDKFDNVVIKNYDDIIVSECGCR